MAHIFIIDVNTQSRRFYELCGKLGVCNGRRVKDVRRSRERCHVVECDDGYIILESENVPCE